MEWSEYLMEFDESANEDYGFADDEEVNYDIVLDMFDEGLTVDEALEDYHNRKEDNDKIKKGK